MDRKFEITDFQSAHYVIKIFTGHKVRLPPQWEWNFNNNNLSTLSWEESIESGQEPKGLELMNPRALLFPISHFSSPG